MNGWKPLYEGFNPQQEGPRKALCTLGNGYFASRGAVPESSVGGIHYPGTYIADKTIENESLVNAPNWLALTFRIENGDWFDIGNVNVLSCHQEPDIKKAILTRTIRFRDPDGRHTRANQRCLVSIEHPHLAALETSIHAEDWTGSIC